MTNKQSELEYQLEEMIDGHGLLHVLSTLSVIAREKADHINASYQDRVLAKTWIRDANRIDRVAREISN